MDNTKKENVIIGQNINVMNNNQTKIKVLNTILKAKDDVRVDDKANEYSNVIKLLDK